MNDEILNNAMSCRSYFMTGGFVGLLGVIISLIALFSGTSERQGGQRESAPSTIIRETVVVPAQSELAEEPIPEVLAINVTGNWDTDPDYGYFYRFSQEGEYVTVEEVAFNGVITGVGEGYITGDLITIDYVAADGFFGSADFTVSSSGNRMTGTFTNWSLGTEFSVVLYRR